MDCFVIKWTVKKAHEGLLLRDFLRHEKQISRTLLTDIKFKGGKIVVNGKEERVRYEVNVGDQIEVYFPKEQRSETMKPIHLPLTIVYEDDHFLLVNKPPNITTIPSRQELNVSLAQAVLYYYEQHHIPSTIHVVNRLDRDTSGLVLIAKHRYVHDLLSKQQKQKTMKRTYLAFVHGIVEKGKEKINRPIGRKEGSIIEREVREDGQAAVTHYQVLEQWKQYALLALSLETGRTHQIRVHMASLQHPLLGDTLYGGRRDFINRQALHSHTLTFYHPFLEKVLTFKASLPEDMKQLIIK
ncbi:RluA family pseudouridine synthase [Bacillus taeanensis]|uniref:Pseudouridine synthase n=1 Tax=Bacillus taeanensis TaxID=273032 RepID=A0A366Y198_9BACI|nr:RluA family pseudouridine synthase [Bacillus taeanensis]RBW69951.1 RNA pseudouridine synthase [Bacillus taeanensis]